MKVLLVVLVAFGVLAAAHGRMEPNSFLRQPAPTAPALMKQISTDAVVMDRYMRHFSMTESEVKNYFSTLRLDTLKAEGVYSVYNVPKSGELRARYFRLRKGTKVWVDITGEPVLKESCGNPMTKGPNRRKDEEVTLHDAEKPIRPSVAEEDQVFVKNTLLEPEIPMLLPDTPVVAEPPPIVTTTAEAPNVFAPSPQIPKILVLIPPILAGTIRPKRNSPPPVPEPASVLVLAVGAAGVIARGVRGRRR